MKNKLSKQIAFSLRVCFSSPNQNFKKVPHYYSSQADANSYFISYRSFNPQVDPLHGLMLPTANGASILVS